MPYKTTASLKTVIKGITINLNDQDSMKNLGNFTISLLENTTGIEVNVNANLEVDWSVLQENSCIKQEVPPKVIFPDPPGGYPKLQPSKPKPKLSHFHLKKVIKWAINKWLITLNPEKPNRFYVQSIDLPPLDYLYGNWVKFAGEFQVRLPSGILVASHQDDYNREFWEDWKVLTVGFCRSGCQLGNSVLPDCLKLRYSGYESCWTKEDFSVLAWLLEDAGWYFEFNFEGGPIYLGRFHEREVNYPPVKVLEFKLFLDSDHVNPNR